MTFKELAKKGRLIPPRTPEADLRAILSGELSQVDLNCNAEHYLSRLYQSGELIKRIEEKELRYYDTYSDYLYVGKTSDNVIQMIRATSAYHYGMCYGYSQADIAFFYLNAHGLNAVAAAELFEFEKQSWEISIYDLVSLAPADGLH
ncbi:MAG TPA: hypothetical protein EYM33_09045 [Pseudomonadales bacterium]|nr:hypothetical protein [Pseudomonadales bacterium]